MPKKPAMRSSKTKASAVKKKVTAKKVKAKVAKTIASKPKKVAPIPKGYNSLTAYLIVANAAKAIDFYKKAFGAKEIMRMDKPGNKIGHAELKIGDSKLMLADEMPEMGARAPEGNAYSPMCIHFYTKNVDATVKMAASLGAKIVRPPEDMFYGDRIAMVQDPAGHSWSIATHVEDVSKAVLKKRAAEMYGRKA